MSFIQAGDFKKYLVCIPISFSGSGWLKNMFSKMSSTHRFLIFSGAWLLVYFLLYAVERLMLTGIIVVWSLGLASRRQVGFQWLPESLKVDLTRV
jgi:hypothetical protein